MFRIASYSIYYERHASVVVCDIIILIDKEPLNSVHIYSRLNFAFAFASSLLDHRFQKKLSVKCPINNSAS
ncbi:hypothetical protein L596_002954 [Steinernema carpocapsae]|uniref:Uncharacterized protein n=1 Tax=Steinernema carpocapsae TaxID=34508 RepID=A0A4U8UQZ2_STECR|nr:hypothetical protein L596_002954 [Steinernema carpocapsae]